MLSHWMNYLSFNLIPCSIPFHSIQIITSRHPILRQLIHSVVVMNAMILIPMNEWELFSENEGDDSFTAGNASINFQLCHKWSKVMQWVREFDTSKKIQCQYSTFFSFGHFLSHTLSCYDNTKPRNSNIFSSLQTSFSYYFSRWFILPHRSIVTHSKMVFITNSDFDFV